MFKQIEEYYFEHPKVIKVLLLPLLLTMLFFIVALIYLNLLPNFILYTIIFISIVIFGCCYYFFNKKVKKGIFPTKCFIVSLAFSLVFALIGYYIVESKNSISPVFNNDKEEIIMSVVVLKDTNYNEITDVSKIAYNENSEINETKQFFKSIDQTITTTSTNNFENLVSLLNNNKVEAIVICESKRFLIETYFPRFSTDTKVIYQYKISKDIKLKDNKIDITKDSFNVLISGLDTYGDINTISRSDVNLLATINPLKHEILITNTPRDYWVNLGTINQMDKLTHAGIYGIEETVTTIEKLYDLEINYYARVNYNSLINIVDAIDGVEINNPYEFGIPNTSYYFPKGIINLNGEQALSFVRERYSLPNGDEDRGKNQQRVLTAIIQKLLSEQFLTNYLPILKSLSNSFITNMPESELSKFVKAQIDNLTPWTIKTISVSGKYAMTTESYSMPEQNISIIIPDETTIQIAKDTIKQISASN